MKANSPLLFEDPEFQILYYQDSEESLYIAFKNKDAKGNDEFPGQTLGEIISGRVIPVLQDLLHKKVNGRFIKAQSFDMDKKFVLLNSNEELAVCNL